MLCVSNNALPVRLFLEQVAQAQLSCKAPSESGGIDSYSGGWAKLRAVELPGKGERHGELLSPWVCAFMLSRPKALKDEKGSSSVAA